MNAYLLKRVAAFALLFVAFELLASLGWFLAHGEDRRTLARSGSEIERLSRDLADERAWLGRRAALDDSIDVLRRRVDRGAGGFETRAGYDSARRRYARSVETWNDGIDEHRGRAAMADSLAAAHDSLVARWAAAYRRAYPGWLLLPRPEPPTQVVGG